jgi:hypothetical protein
VGVGRGTNGIDTSALAVFGDPAAGAACAGTQQDSRSEKEAEKGFRSHLLRNAEF